MFAILSQWLFTKLFLPIFVFISLPAALENMIRFVSDSWLTKPYMIFHMLGLCPFLGSRFCSRIPVHCLSPLDPLPIYLNTHSTCHGQRWSTSSSPGSGQTHLANPGPVHVFQILFLKLFRSFIPGFIILYFLFNYSNDVFFINLDHIFYRYIAQGKKFYALIHWTLRPCWKILSVPNRLTC